MMAKTALLVCALALTPAAALAAQAPPQQPPTTARAAAPIDPTGQWVSLVTEDWRWRMVTPPLGDFPSVPLNQAGREAAYKWDLAADNAAGPAGQCKAFGVGGIARQPGRLRISWADDATLKVEYDAGQQTRTFHFVNQRPGDIVPALTARTPPNGARTLQGETKAQWFKQVQSRGLGFGGAPAPGGSLRTFTSNSSGGYLRKNGVPYSENATITETWNRFTGLEGEDYLVVTTVVEDPRYLNQPFLTSTSFKKETDTSKWNPQPCRTPAPLGPPVPPPAPRGQPAAPATGSAAAPAPASVPRAGSPPSR